MRTFGKVAIKQKIAEITNKALGRKQINANNINKLFDFENIESCRKFICNLHIAEARVKAIQLENGQEVLMENIPEDQIIQRAKELRSAIFGKPEVIKT